MKKVRMKLKPFCRNTSQNHGIDTAAVTSSPGMSNQRRLLVSRSTKNQKSSPIPAARISATGPLPNTASPRKA